MLAEGLGIFLGGCAFATGLGGFAVVGGGDTLTLSVAGFARGSVRGLELMAVTGGVGFLGFIDTRLTGGGAEDPGFRDPDDFFEGDSFFSFARQSGAVYSPAPSGRDLDRIASRPVWP